MYDTQAENGDESEKKMAWIREGGALVPYGEVEVGSDVDRGEGIATDGGVVMADPEPATGCDNCGAGETVTVPDGHRLATDFDSLCPDCAGMDVCTEPGCDAAFWSHKERAEHIQNDHEDEGDRPEGAAACSNCDGEAGAETRIVPDPRVDRGRQQTVCPRCNDVIGGGKFR